MVTFALLTISLYKSGDKKNYKFKKAQRSFELTVLFGLAWIFGVFAIRDAKLAFEYLFCIFSTVYGLLTFIFSVCDLREATREGTPKKIKLKNLTKDESSPPAKSEQESLASTPDEKDPTTPLKSNDDSQP